MKWYWGALIGIALTLGVLYYLGVLDEKGGGQIAAEPDRSER